MAQIEKNGLHDDQWGSRLNRTYTDPALQKMMTFEYGWYMKATIVVFLLDQTAYFDHMHPGVTNIIAQAHDMDLVPYCATPRQSMSLNVIFEWLWEFQVGLTKSLHHIGSLA